MNWEGSGPDWNWRESSQEPCTGPGSEEPGSWGCPPGAGAHSVSSKARAAVGSPYLSWGCGGPPAAAVAGGGTSWLGFWASCGLVGRPAGPEALGRGCCVVGGPVRGMGPAWLAWRVGPAGPGGFWGGPWRC